MNETILRLREAEQGAAQIETELRECVGRINRAAAEMDVHTARVNDLSTQVEQHEAILRSGQEALRSQMTKGEAVPKGLALTAGDAKTRDEQFKAYLAEQAQDETSDYGSAVVELRMEQAQFAAGQMTVKSEEREFTALRAVADLRAARLAALAELAKYM